METVGVPENPTQLHFRPPQSSKIAAVLRFCIQTNIQATRHAADENLLFYIKFHSRTAKIDSIPYRTCFVFSTKTRLPCLPTETQLLLNTLTQLAANEFSTNIASPQRNAPRFSSSEPLGTHKRGLIWQSVPLQTQQTNEHEANDGRPCLHADLGSLLPDSPFLRSPINGNQPHGGG